MSLQIDRLVRIARELAGPAQKQEVIFDGPQSSIRIWTDARSGEPLFQLKGYWPASEIASQTDDQLRQLLNSWPRLTHST